MKEILNLLGLWSLPLIMLVSAAWVMLDMCRQTWVELREWFRRMRS